MSDDPIDSATSTPKSEPSLRDCLVIWEGFPALRNPDTNKPRTDGNDPIPKYQVAAFQNVLDVSADLLEDLRSDCVTIFSARTRESDQAYSAGQTFFCPCQMKPRCALEKLALMIFRAHVDGLDGLYVPEESGAEWWTLVLDDDRRIEDDEGDEVGLHFDADYGLEEQIPDLLLHPRVATVTYLSDAGAPTLVLEKCSPQDKNGKEKHFLAGNVTKGWLCYPEVGTHLCFDGRYLHGAPSTFFPSERRALKKSDTEPPAKQPKLTTTRITFLVNIWLNHCPLEAELLDDDICSQLKTHFVSTEESTATSTSLRLNLTNSSSPSLFDKVTLSSFPADPAGEEVGVICNREVTVKYNASMDALHELSSRGSKLLEITFEGGALTIEVGDPTPAEDETT